MPIRERSPLSRTANSNNSSLSLDNPVPEVANTITMAEISQVEINMAKEMLPEYSGGSKNLAYFIRQVETYIALLKRPEECLFNRLLFEQVKAKLVGEARDVLITTNSANWTLLKDALLQKFGDPRSEEILANDLATCYQNNNESYEQYFEKVKYKLQVLLEHISIRTPNVDIRLSKENMYTNQALMVFKSGILEPYCSHLLNLPITTLEQALFECRRYDNNRSQISFMNFMRNKSKPNNNNKSNFNKQTHNFRPNPPSFYPQFYPRLPNHFNVPNNYNNSHSFNQQSPQPSQFPRGPINITPRPPNTPSNPQISGTRKEQTYRPTPMSMTTKNTFNRQNVSPMSVSTRHNTRQNYFRAQSRPTFISEELYNVENPGDHDQNFDFYPEQEHSQQLEYAGTENEAENFQIPASEPVE